MIYKHKINIDRLEITYFADFKLREYIANRNEVEFDGVKLIRKESHAYANEFIIKVNDYNKDKGIYECEIGYLCFGSFNPKRQGVYINFLNKSLYDEYMMSSRFYIEEAIGLGFWRISKIDIAIDFNFNIVKRFYKVYKDATYSLIMNRKKISDLNTVVKNVVHIAGNTTRKHPFAGPMFCFRNNDKSLSLKVYNKTNEINQSSGKQYIIDNVGFKRLYRMEVSCKNYKELKKSFKMLGMTDEELYSRLQDENTLMILFLNMLDRIFRVQQNRKSYNILDVIYSDLK